MKTSKLSEKQVVRLRIKSESSILYSDLITYFKQNDTQQRRPLWNG